MLVRIQASLLSTLATIWKTTIGLFTLVAGVAAFLSIMTLAGVIEGNPVTVIWEAPADLARGVNALIQIGDSLEGVDLAAWLEETQAAASKFNSEP